MRIKNFINYVASNSFPRPTVMFYLEIKSLSIYLKFLCIQLVMTQLQYYNLIKFIYNKITLYNVRHKSNKYWNTRPCMKGSSMSFTSPKTPRRRRQRAAATSGYQPLCLPPDMMLPWILPSIQFVKRNILNNLLG